MSGGVWSWGEDRVPIKAICETVEYFVKTLIVRENKETGKQQQKWQNEKNQDCDNLSTNGGSKTSRGCRNWSKN